jgi:integrase
MRGSIIKRSENSYRIAVSLGKDPATGKYKQHFETVRGNKKEADKRLSEILHQLDSGYFTKPGKLTLTDYLEQWLRDYCKPNLAPRTTEGYQYIVRTHLVPSLGKIPLTQLKPEHLQRLYAEKLAKGRSDGKGGLSNRSVRYCHVTLHKALQDAVELGMIMRNPAEAVKPPKVHRHEMQVMNESDIHLFLEMARSTPHYSLFYLLLFTGLRRSEALALRWSDLDLLLCQLSVSRTIHQLHNGQMIYGEAKTAKSRRMIALTPSTAIVLREHREAQGKLRQSLGMTLSDDDLVFCHYDGTPYLPDSITHAWRKLALRCGLKGIRLHDARHTHASLMLKQGTPH